MTCYDLIGIVEVGTAVASALDIKHKKSVKRLFCFWDLELRFRDAFSSFRMTFLQRAFKRILRSSTGCRRVYHPETFEVNTASMQHVDRKAGANNFE